MAGLAPLTLREQQPDPEPTPDAQVIYLNSEGLASSGKPNVVIDLPDGGVRIHLNAGPADSKPIGETKFNANLAEHLDDTYLNTLADELLRGIEEDEQSREEWLSERAEGIKLLALKIEKPATQGASGASGAGMSRSRTPFYWRLAFVSRRMRPASCCRPAVRSR